MRRIIALILAVIFCLSLCSCGKSENVRAAEKAISDIGKVTIQNGVAQLDSTISSYESNIFNQQSAALAVIGQ